MGIAQVIRFPPSPSDQLAVEASRGRERLVVEDAVDGGTVFVDLLGFAHELVDGGGISESTLGVEPSLLHAKDRVAASIFCI